MSYLIKLVRGNMPDFAKHDTLSFGQLDHETHVKKLRAKLIEEAAEYVVDGTVDELGDVYDVLAALCWVVHGCTVRELRAKTSKKFSERGGFADGIGMYATDGEDDS